VKLSVVLLALRVRPDLTRSVRSTMEGSPLIDSAILKQVWRRDRPKRPHGAELLRCGLLRTSGVSVFTPAAMNH
jgi:hypothetical protein